MKHSEYILQLLKQSEQPFISSAALCKNLGISRTAIWKQIEQLRQHGYEIESAPNKGYRLQFIPDYWDVSNLRNRIQREFSETSMFGEHIHLLSETSSTQTYAHQLAQAGAPNGTIVLAERQSAGKGRLQRVWQAPFAKGILLSFILRVEMPVHLVSQLTLLTSVALCHSLKIETDLEIGIKWPNDIFCGNKKIAGMLLESVSEATQIHYVIVGVGLNVNQLENDFPSELKNLATSLRIAKGQSYERASILLQFLKQFEHWLSIYKKSGFSIIREAWQSNSISLHQKVRLSTNQGMIEGWAESIDEQGALMIRLADGTTVKNYSGDLEVMPSR